jgi:hypothetical protein
MAYCIFNNYNAMLTINKSLLSGELIMMEISYFVRNDIQWFNFRRGGGGKAANQPPHHPKK